MPWCLVRLRLIEIYGKIFKQEDSLTGLVNFDVMVV